MNNKLIIVKKMKLLIANLKVKFGAFSRWGRITSKRQLVFNRTLNVFFDQVMNLENNLDDALVVSSIKKQFRKSFAQYVRQSVLVTHGFKKPRGYPGDASIIETVYENKPKSNGIGLLLDLYLLQDKYIQAIRDRKDYTKKFLKKYIASLGVTPQRVKILNVACGSCREIRELIKENKIISPEISFTCLDQDAVTVDFAKTQLMNVPSNFKFHFFCENVVNLYSTVGFHNVLIKNQDLIYSIGLADYLPNSVLMPLLRYCFGKLHVGGTLFIAHKNVHQYPEPVSDWFCDWKFIVRTQLEFDFLVRDTLIKNSFSLCYKWSKSGLLFYAIIKRLK